MKKINKKNKKNIRNKKHKMYQMNKMNERQQRPITNHMDILRDTSYNCRKGFCFTGGKNRHHYNSTSFNKTNLIKSSRVYIYKYFEVSKLVSSIFYNCLESHNYYEIFDKGDANTLFYRAFKGNIDFSDFDNMLTRGIYTNVGSERSKPLMIFIKIE